MSKYVIFLLVTFSQQFPTKIYGLFLSVEAALVLFISPELELDRDPSVTPSVWNIKDPHATEQIKALLQ